MVRFRVARGTPHHRQGIPFPPILRLKKTRSNMSRSKVLITDYAWPDLDIEKQALNEAGIELVVAPDGKQETLVELARDVDAIMTNWAQTPAEVIGASGKVQIVARLGIGLDNIDVAYCSQHGIPVTNVPDYCLKEVAEHALAQILTLGRKIAYYHSETKQGIYNLQAGAELRRMELQVVGILGWGNIGRCLAEKLVGIGMKVIAYSRSRSNPLDGVEFCELDELLRQSDYVSLQVPLNDETRHLINADRLRLMKPTAYLVNTARGGIIDQVALTEALHANQIAGAALDVQDPEPPDLSAPLFQDPRVVVTPHAAFVSRESLENLRSRTAQQVIDRLAGRTPECVVNQAALDG